MSDIVERLTALSEEYRDHDPDVVAFTAEAAAEIARLRDDLAAEREERDKLAKEVAHLRVAMSREDGPQYLANLLMEAEAALLNAAQQRDKAERERAAAQEREQRMREALVWLNTELDAYWNDHTQAGRRPPEAYIRRITAAQIACAAALGEPQ